jgi:Glycosyltransferase family 87
MPELAAVAPRINSFADRINRDAVFRILLLVFGAVLFVFALVPVVHSLRGHSTKDYWVWFETGKTVLQGVEIYPDPRWNKFPFMYPPPCALFLAPLSALGQTGLIIVLVGVNAAAWICSIIFSVRLATGGKERGHVLLYLIPGLIMGTQVWGNFLLGQPSLVLLALMLGAFLALRQKLQSLAGGLIALAAAIKAFPLLGMVYLIYRRYWVATATMVLTLIFLLVLAIPFRGYDLAKQDLQRWTSGMLFKYDESGVGQRLGRSVSWKNQSIWGVANRLLRHVEYDHRYEPHTPVYANFADLEFNTVNRIILATALLFGLTFIAVMPRASGRTRETDAIEFALLLLLMLLFTPLSFGYLFVWLLYPLTIVVHRVLADPGPHTGLLVCAGGAVFSLSLSIPFRMMAQTYGNFFFAAVLLFVGLALELWRVKRSQKGPPANHANGRELI